ncbi:MAG: hypothetical protein RLZZ176_689 [Cyanobacteriota bacterium]
MGKSRRDWTQDKFECYIKEGRGQGSGSNYQLWIKIRDFPPNKFLAVGGKSDNLTKHDVD